MRQLPRFRGDHMGPDAFLTKWATEATALRRRRALVDGAALLEEVLADFAAVARADAEEILDLRQAARESQYSADHLGRLVRLGKIPNVGRPHAPRIRRGDLPRKPAALRPEASRLSLLGATPRQIARTVVTSQVEDGR